MNEVYYSQVSMWTEKGYINATNYKKGSLIAVNSPVTISDISNSTISFICQGTTLNLINVPKYTKVDTKKLFERTFKTSKVDFSQFNTKENNSIAKGEVTIGMSKKAVLTSRGYPPAHYTVSLNLNSWKYWDSKFNTTMYVFSNEVVSKIIE